MKPTSFVFTKEKNMNNRKTTKLNHSSKSSLIGSILFSGLLISTAAFSANPVKEVDVTKADGIYINDGKVVVAPVNGEYAQVTSGPTVSYHQKLKADCKSGKSLAYTRVYFGIVNVAGGFLEANDNYYEGVGAQYANEIPYTPVELNVPLNKLGFDPVQVCKTMLENKMANGATKIQVMNQDQVVQQNAGFTGVAACGKIGGDDWYFDRDTIGGSVEVICKAGPSAPIGGVKAPKASIVAVPLGGNGGIQQGDNPLQILDANIVSNSLHFVGSCPRNVSFTTRMKGAGKGHVRYSVVENGKAVYKSAPIPYDQAEGWKQHNFNFEITGEQQDINKKVNRDFALYFELKDEGSNTWIWSNKGAFPGLDWAQTCTAQANVGMGGQGIDSGVEETPGMQFQKADPQGSPKAPLDIQAQPVDPSPVPPMNIQSVPAEPKDQPKRAM